MCTAVATGGGCGLTDCIPNSEDDGGICIAATGQRVEGEDEETAYELLQSALLAKIAENAGAARPGSTAT